MKTREDDCARHEHENWTWGTARIIDPIGLNNSTKEIYVKNHIVYTLDAINRYSQRGNCIKNLYSYIERK